MWLELHTERCLEPEGVSMDVTNIVTVRKLSLSRRKRKLLLVVDRLTLGDINVSL